MHTTWCTSLRISRRSCARAEEYILQRAASDYTARCRVRHIAGRAYGEWTTQALPCTALRSLLGLPATRATTGFEASARRRRPLHWSAGDQSVSAENGSGIAVRNRDDLIRERTGTCLDVVSNVDCGIVEQFMRIRSVCDAFCILRFVNFIAVLQLELDVTHRCASWDWTRNTSWNDCVAVLS